MIPSQEAKIPHAMWPGSLKMREGDVCTPMTDVWQRPTQYCKASILQLGFPDGSDGKESACSVGDQVSGREAPLEKGMATHSSILARKILWTEECRRLLSLGRKGSERVGNG